jgi:mono/diheme cytochrome c family protein
MLVTSLICGRALAHHESKTKKIELLYQDQSVVTLGEMLYQNHCARCHGRNLEGQVNWHKRDQDGYLPAPPHDETGHTWHHADMLLFEMTKYGIKALAGGDYKTKMPIYEGLLSDDDIVAILSYIKSQWPDKVMRIHNEQINQ